MGVMRDHRVLCLFAGLFAVLALLVTQGHTVSLDEFGVLLVRGENQAEDILTTLISNLTHLGDSITLAIVALFTVGVLIWKKERLAARWFLMAAAGSFLITAVSKWAFGRDRPEVVEQFASATSASFPSGHTLRSAVVYALLAFIVTRTASQRANMVIYCAAAAIIIANGLSRVYLGVHWPTDVIGAWLIAGFWLLLCKNGYERSCAKREISVD
ncbi:MAG: phosphatase PAP2 family protein [Kordiimonadaceae bacterium]|nr:phosphatase PAP2 family protein [Kordiimonadaceae bacterium]MBO6570272.1 phosphatase PAP2 family protein [Kordiimonadaceae bacterium]MBO6965630.1 phosphatase PAP2 family protein [Kordiimonadaceae bacterium]